MKCCLEATQQQPLYVLLPPCIYGFVQVSFWERQQFKSEKHSGLSMFTYWCKGHGCTSKRLCCHISRHGHSMSQWRTRLKPWSSSYIAWKLTHHIGLDWPLFSSGPWHDWRALWLWKQIKWQAWGRVQGKWMYRNLLDLLWLNWETKLSYHRNAEKENCNSFETFTGASRADKCLEKATLAQTTLFCYCTLAHEMSTGPKTQRPKQYFNSKSVYLAYNINTNVILQSIVALGSPEWIVFIVMDHQYPRLHVAAANTYWIIDVFGYPSSSTITAFI